jgi:hypothetical protein
MVWPAHRSGQRVKNEAARRCPAARESARSALAAAGVESWICQRMSKCDKVIGLKVLISYAEKDGAPPLGASLWP